ncbi:MAG: hypothetical protein CNE98_02600 [Bacteroidetes bacterium MED-G17]|nr:MAG: hypothetical protein CBB99_00740 [Bacteroidetes bacterium TMED39]PDH53028.1 MAG: hypothetical protein CNE98_02600 [Bacteroidetes bacterium MED-G17]CAI8338571.1 MAG: Uncharacterised protein [Bacteroidetes bacterium MED-G17]|tara:strand:- start:1353 stop:1646 length:294 start_codon:yes stop_codon:yes gene_type:complete
MNPQKKKILFGLLTGIFSPVLLFFLLYIQSKIEVNFGDFLKQTINTLYFLPLIKLALLINLVPFMVSMYLNKIYFSRGVLMATISYAVIFVIFYLST